MQFKKNAATVADHINKTATSEVSFTYYQEDQEAIFAYYCYLLRKIREGGYIRASVIKKFMQFFEHPEKDFQVLKANFLSRAKERTMASLAAMKDYHFSYERPQPRYEPVVKVKNYAFDLDFLVKKHYSLEDFMTGFFRSLPAFPGFNSLLLDNARDRRKDFVVYAFTQLHQYVQPVPATARISFYKQRVIVGVLAAQFGFYLSEKDFQKQDKLTGPYSKYLQEQVAHFCKEVLRSQKKTAGTGQEGRL